MAVALMFDIVCMPVNIAALFDVRIVCSISIVMTPLAGGGGSGGGASPLPGAPLCNPVGKGRAGLGPPNGGFPRGTLNERPLAADLAGGAGLFFRAGDFFAAGGVDDVLPAFLLDSDLADLFFDEAAAAGLDGLDSSSGIANLSMILFSIQDSNMGSVLVEYHSDMSILLPFVSACKAILRNWANCEIASLYPSSLNTCAMTSSVRRMATAIFGLSMNIDA